MAIRQRLAEGGEHRVIFGPHAGCCRLLEGAFLCLRAITWDPLSHVHISAPHVVASPEGQPRAPSTLRSTTGVRWQNVHWQAIWRGCMAAEKLRFEYVEQLQLDAHVK
eukprot:4857437-Prymnesium_polylepis.1